MTIQDKYLELRRHLKQIEAENTRLREALEEIQLILSKYVGPWSRPTKEDLAGLKSIADVALKETNQ